MAICKYKKWESNTTIKYKENKKKMENFVNPKKIKGQDKLNRIKDLMSKMNTLTESKSFSELELIKKGPNGVVYGIIRENHDYFIKTSEKTSGNFVATDFNYVGGVKNKYDERYKSYAEATKHLNMKFDMLNESFNIKKGNSIFESDGTQSGNATAFSEMQGGLGFVLEKNDSPAHPGQTCDEAHPEQTIKEAHPWTEVENEEEEETLIADEKKSVIKVDAPPAPAPPPIEDEVEVDEFATDEVGGDEFEAEEEIDIEGGEEEGDEYTKKIQKLTGKVSQMLRDKDEPDSELDKYVINSIVSAIDWEEIDDEDVEDIIAKIEGEDEEDGDGDEFGSEEVDVDLDVEEVPEGEPTEELAEGEEIEDKETNESKTFTKKQLMESFLKKNVKSSLKKVLKENHRICEECMGGGCPSCEGASISAGNKEGWAPLGEDPMEENLTEIFSDADRLGGDDVNVREDIDDTHADVLGQDILYATGDLDRDGDDIPNRLDIDNNDDGSIDYGIGNKMYDWPERILGRKGDRDSDGIPNKYDDDVDGDGRDDDFIEIDIDAIMGNAPVKEPDIKEPTTKPGTKPRKPRWKKIPRPNVDPRPKGIRRKPSSVRRGIYR